MKRVRISDNRTQKVTLNTFQVQTKSFYLHIWKIQPQLFEFRLQEFLFLLRDPQCDFQYDLMNDHL